MRIKKYLFLSLFLILGSLLFTACSTPANTSHVSMGRYLESDWDVSSILNGGEISSMTVDSDNTLNIYISHKDTLELYKLNAKGQYTKQNIPWLNDYKKSPVISRIYPTSSGEVYFTGETKDNMPCICKAVNDQIKPLPIDWAISSKSLTYIKDLAISKSGNLFVIQNDYMIRSYDPNTGKCLKTYGDFGFSSIAIYEDILYGINTQTSELIAFDINTGSKVKALACPTHDESCDLTIDLADNSLYLSCNEGIWHLTQTGSIWEQVVDGNLCSLGLTSLHLSQNIIYNGIFFTTYYSSVDNQMLYKQLSYSTTTPTRPSTQINIYSLHDNDILQDVIHRYQSEHPDVYIKLFVGVNDNITEEMAIQNLNTQILS